MDGRDKADFFDRVFAVVKLIPPGRVSTYGAIARYLGTGSSARTVGWAMNAAHSASESVPAHRVVNRLGMLTGKHHFPGPDAMQRALEQEGIAVQNDAVIDFDRLFWDPARELEL